MGKIDNTLVKACQIIREAAFERCKHVNFQSCFETVINIGKKRNYFVQFFQTSTFNKIMIKNHFFSVTVTATAIPNPQRFT